MKKQQLIKHVADEIGMSKIQSEILLEEIFESLAMLLENGESFSIPRFGKFLVVQSSPRVCRNPKTGETVHVPEKNKLRFKPSLILKKRVVGESD